MNKATEDYYASRNRHDFSHDLRETVRAERQPLINQIVNHQVRRTTQAPFCYAAMGFWTKLLPDGSISAMLSKNEFCGFKRKSSIRPTHSGSSASVSQLASKTCSGITFSLTQSDPFNKSSHIIIIMPGSIDMFTGRGGENPISLLMT